MIKIIPDEIIKIRIFKKARWPKGVIFPRCGCFNISKKGKQKDSKNIYYCPDCRKRGKNSTFNDLTGSIFHNVKIPFGKLCLIIHFFTENYSATKTAKTMKQFGYQINIKTIFRIFHLFREALKQNLDKKIFSGNHFECDEVYLSAKIHTQKFEGYKTHKQLRFEGIKRGIGSELQTPVFTLVSKTKSWLKKKDGSWKMKNNFNVQFDIIEKADRKNLKNSILKRIPINKLQFCTVDTDTHHGYFFLDKLCNHQTVKHSEKEYVSKETGCSINCSESWHSWIKTIGFKIYRMISRKYLLNYLYEFAAKLRGTNNEDDFTFIFGLAFKKLVRKQNGEELSFL